MHIGLLKELIKKDLTIKQISEITNSSFSSTRYWLTKYNLKTKKSNIILKNKMSGPWEDIDRVKRIILESNTISNVLKELELNPVSGNYSTFKKFIKKYNIDISHFKITGEINKNIYSKISLEDVLVENSLYSRKSLKRRLLREGFRKNECELCGLTEWNGEKLIMILDHINGNNTDNRLENLRMVCPNCNSQLPTHCRGHKKINNVTKPKCIDCEKPLSEKRSKRCISCNNISKGIKTRKCKRPSYKILIKQIETLGFSGTGKKYNVSDNAIRKWVKSYDKTYFIKSKRRIKNA